VSTDPSALLATLRSALSHELGQPLAVARGYLELLQTRNDETTKRVAPARIREAIERAVLLSDHLARLVELELDATICEEPGPEAMAWARDHVAGLAASRDVRLDEEGVPGSVDPVSLGLVLAAAIERAERGSAVRMSADERAVRVTWDGDGVPPVIAARVEAQEWAGDTASLGLHVARRRLAATDAELRLDEREVSLNRPG
jgi:signal transduction histidine kinase